MARQTPYNLRRRKPRNRMLFGKPLVLKNAWSIRQMKTLYRILNNHIAPSGLSKFELAQSIRKSVAASKCYKWYIQHKLHRTLKAREEKKCSNTECPITLDTLDASTTFRRLTSNGVCLGFDTNALISYLLTQDHFQCPMTREPFTPDDGLVLQHLADKQQINTKGVNMYIASMSEKERRKFRVRITRQNAFDQLLQLVELQRDVLFAMAECSFIDIILVNYRMFCNLLHNLILMGSLFKSRTIGIIDEIIEQFNVLASSIEQHQVFRSIYTFFTQCRTNVIDHSHERLTQDCIVDVVILDDTQHPYLNNTFLEVR